MVIPFSIRSTRLSPTVKAFQPAATKGKLAFLLTIPKIGGENCSCCACYGKRLQDLRRTNSLQPLRVNSAAKTLILSSGL